MKTPLAILVLAFGTCAQAQTNFYTTVTNLWYQGNKSNVLAMANARLAVNSNDIAGLILKMEYHFEFLEMPEISNSFWRVINVGDTITTSNFVAKFPDERENFLQLLQLFTEHQMSPAELATEQAKGNINHKDMPTDLIEALQKDGYFNQ
jgi:hypothetical protein